MSRGVAAPAKQETTPAARLSPDVREGAVVLVLTLASITAGRYLTVPAGGLDAVAWPATGVSIGLLLRYGLHVWPSLLVGAFLGILLVPARGFPEDLLLAFGGALGTCAAGMLSALLVRRFVRVDAVLHDYREAVRFLGLALVAQLPGIVLLGGLLLASGQLHPADLPATLLAWWRSGSVGIATLTPLTLAWPRGSVLKTLGVAVHRALRHENLLFLVAAGAALLWVFVLAEQAFPVFVLPAFVAIVYRHPGLGSAVLVPLLLFLTTWSTRAGHGPFATQGGPDLVRLGMFHVVLAATGLVLSAVFRARNEAVDALARSQRVLQALIDASRSLIIVKDVDGRYLTASRQCEEIIRVPLEEALGRTATELFPPAVARVMEEQDRRILETGETIDWEQTVTFRDGKPRIFASSKFPLVDGSGVAYAIGSVSTDITERLAERRAAEDRLRSTVSLLKATLESTTDGILVVDRAKGVVISNERFRRMWGLSDESLAEGHDEALLAAVRDQLREPAAFEAQVRALYETADATSFDVLELKDGRVFERFSQPQTIDDRIVGRVWSFRDVTGRRRVEEARDQLMQRVDQARAEAEFLARAGTVLATSLDAATTFDAVATLAVPTFADWCTVDLLEDTGVVRRVAAAHHDPAKAALLRELRELMPPSLDSGDPAAEAMRTGEPRLVPDVTTAVGRQVAESDRRLFDVVHAIGTRSVLATPLVLRGRVVGALTFHATTPNRFGPGNLALAQQLAQRCALAIENAQLYAQAQRSIQVREEFMAIASHELRTPLTPLRMQIHLMKRLARSESPQGPAWRDRLQSVIAVSDRQVERLARLVETLLDTSRLSAGRLELERTDVDLRALVRETLADLDADLARAGCRVTVDAPEPIIGRFDRLRLGQVVTNLATNALKFGREAPIDVTLRATPGMATLRVRDHGPGIPEGDRPRIFERFERIRSVDHVEGVGLGLYIARQLVLLHGGAIRVEDTAGPGATFVVELPLAQATTPTA